MGWKDRTVRLVQGNWYPGISKENLIEQSINDATATINNIENAIKEYSYDDIMYEFFIYNLKEMHDVINEIPRYAISLYYIGEYILEYNQEAD